MNKGKTLWDKLSSNIGDFSENYLWGVGKTESKRKDFFKKKYGDNWEEKYESTRKNVRSLYGLIPQKSGDAKRDAVIYAMSLIMARPAQGMKTIFRGTTLDVADMTKIINNKKYITGGKDYKGNLFFQESPLIGSGYMVNKQMGAHMEKAVAGLAAPADRWMNKYIGSGTLMRFDVPEIKMWDLAVGGKDYLNYGRISKMPNVIHGAREIELRKPLSLDYLTKTYKGKEIKRYELPWTFK
tara:strand:- start:3543 stop:4262 length:720 start_codon:yes stop_codon:yes gene_type:complete